MPQNLSEIDPRDFDHSVLPPKKILAWLKKAEACWMYEGGPSPDKPHAELTSGKCSNGYFDSLRLLCYPNICEILGRQIAIKLRELQKDGFPPKIDWVVSSSYAAITLGHEVAKALGAVFLMAEKDPADPDGKKMVWRRMTIPEGAVVLQVEELITTSGTFQKVRQAVEEGNSNPVSFVNPVATLIHRPTKLPMEYDGRKVIALFEKEIQNFDPADCPYCAVGSPRYRPKTHWKELTGKA